MLDKYEKMERNANRRNNNNVELLEELGISSETAELIAFTLPAARHGFHKNSENFFFAENHREMRRHTEIFSKGLASVDQLLGTSYSSQLISDEDWIDDNDYYEFGTYDDLEECRDAYNDQAEETNNLIEKAMRAIDAKYGTDIAPTGAARMLI